LKQWLFWFWPIYIYKTKHNRYKNQFMQTTKTNQITRNILIAMVLGMGVGVIIHHTQTPETAKSWSEYLKVLATIFIRLVQMIIAPLVFSTLVVGIAKLGDVKAVGRIGGKAMLWFFTASLISLLIGMFWVNFLQPGTGLVLTSAETESLGSIAETTTSFSVQHFVEHIIPKSVFEALATNEILQIVVFSIFFGLAAASQGESAQQVVKALEKISHIILKMVGYVMQVAPFGVFGAIAAVFAVREMGELLWTYANYFGSFLIGIGSLWVLFLLVGYVLLGKQLKTLLKKLVGPLMIAFGTTSSEAVFPKLTEELESFGIPNKVVSFMLPLGYSFNLDGSMMYMTFASLFIAQVYHVPLDFGTQLTMLLVLLLTSKGIAGVPRASLVVVAATCGMFKIPIEGIALILPIDHFCDMFRSATNVMGNALATVAVDKWEKD
jgi:Na+/H+-dicarboxylate symporter